MTKLQISLIGAVVAAGVVASVIVRNRTQVQLAQREAAARQQDQQLAELTFEQERLSHLVKQGASAPAADPATELAVLRAQAAGLRSQNHDLAKQVEAKRPSPQAKAVSASPQYPPEYYIELGRLAGGKIADGRSLGLACASYAAAHGGRFPTSLAEVTAFCAKERLALTGTNQFEMVFKGSPDKVKIPRGEIALFRDRHIWPGPDGKMRRIYVMADGAVQNIQADDNFQAWEAEHLISR